MHRTPISFFYRICCTLIPVPGSGTPCSLLPGPRAFPWQLCVCCHILSDTHRGLGTLLSENHSWTLLLSWWEGDCTFLFPLPVWTAVWTTTLTPPWLMLLSMGTPCTAWPKTHSEHTSNVDAATLLADQPLRVNNPHVHPDLSWSALNSSLREKEFLENLESCQKTRRRTEIATAWLRLVDEKTSQNI